MVAQSEQNIFYISVFYFDFVFVQYDVFYKNKDKIEKELFIFNLIFWTNSFVSF